MVDTGFQAIYLANEQIGFKRMPGAAAGNSAQCGVGLATDGFDTLTGPEQER